MVEETQASQLEFLQEIISGLPYKILVSILIFLAGFIIGKIAGKVVHKVLNELEVNRIVRSNLGLKINIESIVSTLVSSVFYLISLVLALSQLGIVSIILYFLIFGLIALMVMSLFVGIRDFFPNAMAGLYLLNKKMYKEGDTIEMDKLRGKVVKIELVHTEIRTGRGDTMYIPNSLLNKKNLSVLKGKRSKTL